MQNNWEQLQSKLLFIKQEIYSQAKRAIKKEIPKSESVRQDIRDNLVSYFNKFTQTVALSWFSLNETQKHEIRILFMKIRDKVLTAFLALKVNYMIPSSCVAKIDPNILIDLGEHSDELVEMPLTAVEFFNLASKIVPNEFDGAPDKLLSFIDALSLLSLNSEGHVNNAIAYVKTRLIGKARDLITNEVTLEAIINTLKKGIKGDSSRLLTAKILNLKQNNKNAVGYATEIESLASSLKRAFINEGVPCEVAENYATETTVKAFSQNASTEKARIIMEAGTFNTIQDAVTKFVNTSPQSNDVSIFHIKKNYRQYNNRQFNHGHSQFNNRAQQHGRGFVHRGRGYRGGRGIDRYNNSRYNNYSHYTSHNTQPSSVRFYETHQNSGNEAPPQQLRLGEEM